MPEKSRTAAAATSGSEVMIALVFATAPSASNPKEAYAVLQVQ
jgi:hypothetical protein